MQYMLISTLFSRIVSQPNALPRLHHNCLHEKGTGMVSCCCTKRVTPAAAPPLPDCGAIRGILRSGPRRFHRAPTRVYSDAPQFFGKFEHICRRQLVIGVPSPLRPFTGEAAQCESASSKLYRFAVSYISFISVKKSEFCVASKAKPVKQKNSTGNLLRRTLMSSKGSELMLC